MNTSCHHRKRRHWISELSEDSETCNQDGMGNEGQWVNWGEKELGENTVTKRLMAPGPAHH